MNIVFLDIDGVLNSEKWYNSKEYKDLWNPLNESFDTKALNTLNYLINKINWKIVISSSWRSHFNLEELSKELYSLGINCDIIWITPNYEKEKRLEWLKKSRWNEVKLWLEDNKDIITQYVILDDNDDFLEEQKVHFIHINWKVWLTNSDMKKALNIFNL